MAMFRYRFLSKLRSSLTVLAAGAMAMVFATSCQHTVEPTTMEIKDSIRHYYPIVQKDELRMSYDITNTGKEPLVITEILPVCSAITLESGMPEIIPPGKTEKLEFLYHSGMNIGYVNHDIHIYGNMLPEGEALISFDVHVVHPTLDKSDYEEIHFEEQSKMAELVDGKLGEKGYWVGDGTNADDFSHNYHGPTDF